jgi:phosphorylcholine metabolism protein LicD
MARKTIVSLVSDQTIPNVLFIREQPKADHYLFVSTDKMEIRGVVANICKSCSDHVHSHETIVVEEDSLEDITNKLNSFTSKDEGNFIVNLTGGTKVMSLGVFEYYSKSPNNQICYLPLGKNKQLQLFPSDKPISQDIIYRINLEDYLIANGVLPESNSFLKKNSLLRSEEKSAKLYQKFSSESNQLLKIAAEHFRKYRNEKKLKKIELNNEEKWYLQPFLDAGFLPEFEGQLTKEEIKYLTGDWFEEYVYTLVKSIKEKNDNDIGFGIYLTRDNVKNEFDVIFTQKNALYVIECKTDVANEEGKFAELFNNTLYKAGSLKKDFGLFVKFYVFAINDFTKLSKEKLDRARVLDINLVGIEILNDKQKVTEFVSKM